MVKNNMGMKQIVTAAGIVNAQIIVGFLEGANIHATFAPAVDSLLWKGTTSATTSQSVYVSEEKAEEALKLLKEQGLITS